MKKKSLIPIIFFIFSIFAFCQEEKPAENELTAIQKILARANDAFEKDNIDEAYRTINGALKIDEDAIGVIYFARIIYARKLEALKENYNAEDFIEIQANLEEFENLSDAQIKKLVRLVEMEHEEENPLLFNRKIISIILGILIILTLSAVIFMFVFMLLVKKNMKQQNDFQEQYLNNFSRFVAAQSNYLSIGGLSDLYTENLKLAGSSVWDFSKALPDVDFSEEDLNELREYAVKCEALGTKIDEISGRKNNSKNVSELVYKLSIKLGLPQGMAMLNFCAAMVYDAGFLGMDPELLTSTDLSDEQWEALKKHVNIADKYLDFVPKKYWSVFDDAARKHHENMDGSGYPHGLKGEEIPQIARLIRVAETYVSLSSKRNYRQTFDKESAIATLKEQPQFYDSAVVKMLETIV
ncbi:MAG: hypothetical protein K5829_00730 [Treponema sp.]|nr:hypothetical protein [Treponema sp.]